MIKSAPSCSSLIYPDLWFCKASGAEYAILTEGRKTEAINHKTVATFPVVPGQDEASG